MNKLRLGLIFYFGLILTNGLCQDHGLKPKYSVSFDIEKGSRLLKQCSRGTPDNISSYWTVTADEIKVLEDNFEKIKKLKSTDCCYPGTAIGNLSKYGFQYIGVTIYNKRYIYINAFEINSEQDFQTMYKNWRTEPIIMCDGGESYWGVLFDLDKLKFKELVVNGVA